MKHACADADVQHFNNSIQNMGTLIKVRIIDLSN
jgi:hypothetical protein